MPVIGTAGHVDHGKSTLVQRLTGRDPDRWAEEKRRGLTIDLGFAWAVLPGGVEVSFVDVPGHQRFARNMLAGVEAVDIALLVVGGDEGWMPQSEEHLVVLDLLEIAKGVVAITKTDLLAADDVDMARLETEERLAGTSLARAPIIPVSATSGHGIEDLVAELARLAGEVRVRDRGRPRLWIDRVFTATGAGLVVTGTLLDGVLSTGDPVSIYPSGDAARIRSIQSHETVLETVGPGRRVALNLAGADRSGLARGDMLGAPDGWRVTNRFAVSIRGARYAGAIDKRGAYHLHVGSGAYPVTITGLDPGMAMLRTEKGLPLAVGDRFILRDTGRRLVVAGGRVLDPGPGSTMSALSRATEIDPSGEPDVIATSLLRIRRTALQRDLEADSGGGTPVEGDQVGAIWLADGVLEGLEERAVELVAGDHREHPLRVGIKASTLARRLGVAQEVVERVVGESRRLERREAEVSLAGREVEIPPDIAAERDRVLARLDTGLEVPTVDQLGADPELVHLLARTGQVVRVSSDLVLLPEQAEEIRRVVTELPDGFTIADFRERTGISRKYIVPYLEWTDAIGLTARRGDARWVR